MKAKTRRNEANEVVKSCCNQNGRKFNLSAGRTAAIATRSQMLPRFTVMSFNWHFNAEKRNNAEELPLRRQYVRFHR